MKREEEEEKKEKKNDEETESEESSFDEEAQEKEMQEKVRLCRDNASNHCLGHQFFKFAISFNIRTF